MLDLYHRRTAKAICHFSEARHVFHLEDDLILRLKVLNEDAPLQANFQKV
jgi:hypothetical protein